MKAHNATSSEITSEPASASASACPRPTSDCGGQLSGPWARRRAALQLRKLGISSISPRGRLTTERCTGTGMPITPPVYWIASVNAPLAPGRLGENVGVSVAEVASGAAAVRAAPEAFTRTGATNAAQIVRATASVHATPVGRELVDASIPLRIMVPILPQCPNTLAQYRQPRGRGAARDVAFAPRATRVITN